MKWNLEWLRTFKAVYETGTLSAAAQLLFISQPGASLHLSSLESFIGYKLFDRAVKKMVPTEKGKILYNFILDPLEKLDVGEKHFHKRSLDERSTLSVGMCFETFQFTLEENMDQLPFNLIIKFGDYRQMEHDLDNGIVDLVVTHQPSTLPNLQYKAFSKERIVLIAGSETETDNLKELFANGNYKEATEFLKRQLWYSTAADMEHLKHFWLKHFNGLPDFNPNFIVPNICSIIRGLSNGKGFSVVPDFLCYEAINENKIKLIWEGNNPLENTLYFGTRKKTFYTKEIAELEELFKKKMIIKK
ncbi:LysR family transcriptional regulator [Chryseobacterium sp. B21-037]|uniref:LysR family transcriptional regulator n=1 Tax=Chryseobacterium sp. B21-037 TaxID=2926038 RepID=UPI00235A1746|nr:LysR family transcriptional regulator [Chryseobacterium sp. B21-037]MDC8104980.1 LysR family transcriptional regulator [Chryseobacterium sp. B21-037]